MYNWIWTFPRDAHRDLYEDPMCSLQIVSCRYLDPVVRHIKGMPQCDKIYNKQNGSVRPSKQNSAFIRLRALYTEKCPLLFFTVLQQRQNTRLINTCFYPFIFQMCFDCLSLSFILCHRSHICTFAKILKLWILVLSHSFAFLWYPLNRFVEKEYSILL